MKRKERITQIAVEQLVKRCLEFAKEKHKNQKYGDGNY